MSKFYDLATGSIPVSRNSTAVKQRVSTDAMDGLKYIIALVLMLVAAPAWANKNCIQTDENGGHTVMCPQVTPTIKEIPFIDECQQDSFHEAGTCTHWQHFIIDGKCMDSAVAFYFYKPNVAMSESTIKMLEKHFRGQLHDGALPGKCMVPDNRL